MLCYTLLYYDIKSKKLTNALLKCMFCFNMRLNVIVATFSVADVKISDLHWEKMVWAMGAGGNLIP